MRTFRVSNTMNFFYYWCTSNIFGSPMKKNVYEKGSIYWTKHILQNCSNDFISLHVFFSLFHVWIRLFWEFVCITNFLGLFSLTFFPLRFISWKKKECFFFKMNLRPTLESTRIHLTLKIFTIYFDVVHFKWKHFIMRTLTSSCTCFCARFTCIV